MISTLQIQTMRMTTMMISMTYSAGQISAAIFYPVDGTLCSVFQRHTAPMLVAHLCGPAGDPDPIQLQVKAFDSMMILHLTPFPGRCLEVITCKKCSIQHKLRKQLDI
mmetsp:Transcript_16063/g.37893  ORF Transcript_16063/g.37893 Transcript_16063/m.37893 type:complete len:108 (+) Transcript_16063:1548-1871(+)